MKKLILFFLFFAAAFGLLSCGGNAPDNSAGKTTSAASPDNNSSAGEASFSCKLDGKEISGKGTDQNINGAFHLTGENKGQIFFRLSDINNSGDKLQFQVPARTGQTIINNAPNHNYIGYVTQDLANYIDDSITVTINSFSAARVSGTFSGKYSLQEGSGNNNSKQTIEVTDGKFDIPFSTSAQWKQLYNAE